MPLDVIASKRIDNKLYVLTKGNVEDWAVYYDYDWKPDYVVAREGMKASREKAQGLFPDHIKEGDLYRR